MEYTIEDDRVKFSCGCSFQVTGPPYNKSGFPAIKFNPDTFYQDHDINFSCVPTWELLMKGRTVGVFQLESGLAQNNARKLRPDDMNELAALSAIIRPGVSQSKDENGVSMTDHYCKRKNYEEDFTFFHESLRPALEKTWGILIYQESAMRIAQDLAGYTEQEADGLRKAIGKKLPEEMAKNKILFIEGCKKKGIVTEEAAAQIFDWIEKSQRYAFNRCKSFDTKMLRPNGGRHSSQAPYTLEEMYNIRNDINYAKRTGHLSLYKKWKLIGNYGKGLSMCEDGRIRPNTIEDIQPAGLKKVYKITLKNGSFIRTTGNHKFPTNHGEMIVDDIIAKGYENVLLYSCGEYEQCKNKYAYSSLTNEDRKNVSGTSGTGVFGEENRWFTNGSFTEFQNFRKSTPDICADCFTTDKRIETHHIDGDRANSSWSNLVKLCVSCHKKKEYAAGRVRRGEKGYPSLLMEIDSIVEDGECMTYDVTMAAPNHNFVVDGGIVTSNSHAIGYGILGYICAYVKCHFPLQFYTSSLLYSQGGADSKEKIQRLSDDAKLVDIFLMPPDITLMENNFHTDGKNIYFGISDIKDVGVLVLDSIKDLLAEKNIDINTVSWYDFLIDVLGNVSSRAATRLIEAGALRRFNIPRKRMLLEYNIWHTELKKETERQWIIDRRTEFTDISTALKGMGKVRKEGGGCFNKKRVELVQDLIKSLDNPPSPFDDTPDWIAWCEKECLGISLTYSELYKYDVSRASHTCKDIIDGHKAYAVLGVYLKSVRVVKTKTGKSPGQPMAFINASDDTCTLESIVAFPKTWKEFSSLLTEGSAVFISGKMNRGGSFQIEKVYPVEDDD